MVLVGGWVGTVNAWSIVTTLSGINETTGGGVTFDFEENWTSPTGWSALPSGWDDTYSGGTSIDGTSLLMTSVGSITKSLGASYDNLTAIFKFNFQGISSTGSVFLEFLDSGDQEICAVALTSNTSPTPYRLYAYYNNVGSSSYDSSFTNSGTGVWYVKISYEKGTGLDGHVQVWAVTQANYDATGWASAETVDVTGTSDTAQISKIMIANSAIFTNYTTLDTLRADHTQSVDY